MKILALDQSLQTTGWAVFDNSNNDFIAYDHFTIQSNKPIEHRLYMIWSKLSELHSLYDFDKIYFEDIQMQRGNALTFKKLAYVQATIMLWCYNMNISYEIFSASHWRKILKDTFGVAFGRSRAEQKAAATAFVKKRFNADVTEDEADAILIGLSALCDKHETIEWGD